MFDWLPGAEDLLKEMLDHGLLFERHTVDFKRELDLGKGANKEHARDMAQFAIDGGVLIIGVDDNDKTSRRSSPRSTLRGFQSDWTRSPTP